MKITQKIYVHFSNDAFLNTAVVRAYYRAQAGVKWSFPSQCISMIKYIFYTGQNVERTKLTRSEPSSVEKTT